MKHRWLCDLLVLTVMVYFGVDALIKVFDARLATDPLVDGVYAKAAAGRSSPARPLEEYGVIFKRNLFGRASEEETAPAAEEAVEEEIPLASKSLGLRLVGTVVRDSAALNLAIIEERGTRKQEAYYQGDRVKQALIKSIRRQSVIINAGERDEILTMDQEEDTSRATSPAPPARKTPFAPGAGRTIRLKREELDTALTDLDQLMKQVRIRPFKEGNKPGGFMVSNIKPGSLFAKMGLRNGDVIQRLNDETITETEQAIELYESLMQGGEVALEIKRGRRTQRLLYDIQ